MCWRALNIDESILRFDGVIRSSLRALDINITVHIHARSILLHLLSPSSHIPQERLHILLFAQVDWLFVVANLSDLSACCNNRETKIVLVQLLIDRASDLPNPRYSYRNGIPGTRALQSQLHPQFSE